MKFLLVVIFSFGMLACGSKSTQKSESSVPNTNSIQNNLEILKMMNISAGQSGVFNAPLPVETLYSIQRTCDSDALKLVNLYERICYVEPDAESVDCQGLDESSCYSFRMFTYLRCTKDIKEYILKESPLMRAFSDIPALEEGFNFVSKQVEIISSKCKIYKDYIYGDGHPKSMSTKEDYADFISKHNLCQKDRVFHACGAALLIKEKTLIDIEQALLSPNKYSEKQLEKVREVKSQLNQDFLPFIGYTSPAF